MTRAVFDFITHFYYFFSYSIITSFLPFFPLQTLLLSFKFNGLFFLKLLIVIDGASDLPRRHNFIADSPVLWLYSLSTPPPLLKSSLYLRLQELFY